MFYKVIYHHIALLLLDYVTPKCRILQGEHEHQYTLVSSRTDVFKFSYFHITIRFWYILPATLILKTSAEIYKNSLQVAIEDGLVYLVLSRGMYMLNHASEPQPNKQGLYSERESTCKCYLLIGMLVKATFSVHEITTKNTQMPSLHVYTN